MASPHNLRKRNAIDWKKLCYGEPVPHIKKERVVSREVLDGSYQIERLISKKKDAKQGEMYFVKWAGYAETESTWEPRCHIDDYSLSEYIPSTIDVNRLRTAAKGVEDIVQQRLRPGNRCATVTARFDLDIYRYCFQTDETVLLSLKDFERLPLIESWYYRIDSRGQGHAVDFPVRLSPTLRFKKLYVRSDEMRVTQKSMPYEAVKFTIPTCAY